MNNLLKESRKTIWVLYTNSDGCHEVESKKPSKIWADRFNPEHHKKLFFKNLFSNFFDTWRDKMKKMNHPQFNNVVTGTIATVIGGAILILLFGK
jgi:preprotein translocase subunit SecE